MPKAFEIRQQKAARIAEANAIHDRAEGEDRAKTPEERTAFEGKLAEAAALEVRAVEAGRVDELRATADDRGTRLGDPLPHNGRGRRRPRDAHHPEHDHRHRLHPDDLGAHPDRFAEEPDGGPDGRRDRAE